jgi:hypothetical protein
MTASSPLYAGGAFFGAEDRERMCSSLSNTVEGTNRCVAYSENANGIRECTKWSAAPTCAKLLDEIEPTCNPMTDEGCSVTPGEIIRDALEQQLEGAP